MTRPLLLDTHVWIWLMLGDSRLGKPSRKLLEEAVPAGRLLVSIISVWETAMLEVKGRITLAADCDSWIRQALSAPGVRLAELTPEIAVSSTRLPPPFSGDPADRILVATARETGATLVTADRAILDYARRGHLRTAAA